ncbi:hsp70 nucleotide exchange factor fes1 [Drosophila pseudoobscura]|uniref:Hsp70 nucleotide exchange factor fes1 n=1 Tax=Drosophila pseudoobscura pseudoobscura TaxID=46245 RepID=A0A6I8UCT8_DROPS|nr:hsp70 nucleotide exchange factor fes1 [Drosophila pseudoobscura]
MSDNSPRRSLNLQGVLKYAVAHTTSPEADAKPSTDLDDEKSRFLEGALNSLTVGASNDFKTALEILDSPETSTEEKKESLNHLRSHIDDIDLANSLAKMGGTKTLIRYITMPEKDLQALSINIVAEMAQNNIFCQDIFTKEKFLPALTRNLSEGNENANIVRCSIYAISSIIRSFQPGMNEFKRINGIKALLPCLKSSNSDVYIKAAFLIASLSSLDKSFRDAFLKADAFSILFENLRPIDCFDVKQETTLYALSTLSLKSNLKLSAEKRKDLDLTLAQIISKNNQNENCEDMVNYAKNIVENLKTLP